MDLLMFYAKLKWWAWFVFTKGFMGTIYVSLVADGMRTLVPVLGTKVYQAVPFLSELKFFEGTHKLDLAPFAAVGVCLVVAISWERILSMWFGLPKESYWDVDKEMLLVMIVGPVLLFADLAIFYTALTASGWGETEFSGSALLMTCSYGGVMIYVSYVSIRLGRDITLLQKERVSHGSKNDASRDVNGQSADRSRRVREPNPVGSSN